MSTLSPAAYRWSQGPTLVFVQGMGPRFKTVSMLEAVELAIPHRTLKPGPGGVDWFFIDVRALRRYRRNHARFGRMFRAPNSARWAYDYWDNTKAQSVELFDIRHHPMYGEPVIRETGPGAGVLELFGTGAPGLPVMFIDLSKPRCNHAEPFERVNADGFCLVCGEQVLFHVEQPKPESKP